MNLSLDLLLDIWINPQEPLLSFKEEYSAMMSRLHAQAWWTLSDDLHQRALHRVALVCFMAQDPNNIGFLEALITEYTMRKMYMAAVPEKRRRKDGE